MLNSDLSPAARHGGRVPPTEKPRVVSSRRRVQTNWVSGRTFQPSIESVEHIGRLARMSVLDTEVDGSNPGSSMLFP